MEKKRMESNVCRHQSRRVTFVAIALLMLAGSFFPMHSVVAQDGDCAWPSDSLELMAPAGPGGGWDTTARELQRVIDEEGLIETGVEVFNVEGAGGTIGLADLVNQQAGNENMLMVMGLVMIGSIGLNAAPVTLEQVTPIARLTGEWEVIVVPADSPYQSLDELVADFEADPGAISWGGGSAGGTDHLLIALMAQQLGIDPTLVNYVPFSGGGEALASVLGGQTTAGVSGFGEWAPQIEAGELRALAISGRDEAGDDATPVADGDLISSIPTLQEQGIDLELSNWRGIVAPPEISPEVTACIVAVFEELVSTESWQATVESYGWSDLFLGGDEYGAYLTEQIETINQTLLDLGLI